MANPSSNVPLNEQQPATPTVQIPDPPPPLLQQQQQQQQLLEDQSPKSPKPSTVPAISTPTPAQVKSPGKSPSSGSGRHPSYRGIRSRSGKWVSEIREPRKTTRIWLGTYPTPEMAATAYDVAAIALNGPDTCLNFPDHMILSYPKVGSTSASDIRAAAASAAASKLPKPDTSSSSKDSKQVLGKPEDEGTIMKSTSSCMESGSGEEFIDEDEFLNFPNLMVDMAEGMLVSPPNWINSPPSDDSPDNSDGESLWTCT